MKNLARPHIERHFSSVLCSRVKLVGKPELSEVAQETFRDF